MDSNNSNITTSSTGGTDHFFPTSTTHFFDPLSLPTFLDSSPATSSSWPPPPPTEQTNHPACSTGAAAKPTPRRPSKKRSRASRRAPTTVLTTDTSNFRAMVQEFTGIPAPPFASLPFPRSVSSSYPPPPPSFLIKPGFADNFQPPASGPINFQSLLQSQLLNLQTQPAAAPATVPSSGELSLQQQHVDPAGSGRLDFPPAGPGSMAAAAAAVAALRNEKGYQGGGREDGLLESWMCSSD